MRKKLLLVEDNTELRELMRLGLKQAGFSVTTAANGLEALKKAAHVRPDLIILDLVLPEMDGFAVCERLRRDDETSTVPIVLLTGLSSEISRLAGMEAGANDYVTKPVSPDELVSKVKYWLKHSTAAPMPPPQAKRELSASTRY